ncbi:MAG: hypothetical protein CVV27_00490 [Candidatus Melainabacteria bacterium HGW-Melainabacteria-1]|nr:MAG: hypothetical protein CVV27_00490 [Candidatus Melainabacteria bacterium HGW-Melainabacteria-1]
MRRLSLSRLILSLVLLFTPLSELGALAQAAEPTPKATSYGIPASSQQLILVLTDSWQAIPAKLYRYQRASADASWSTAGQPIAAVVGRKGLGWGRGLHSPADTNGDYRVEFDKRAPAGIFALGTVFGLASESQARHWLGGLRMPYLELTESIRCIGDHDSQHYNTLVDIHQVKSDWRDAPNEKMREIAVTDEKAYQWGVFINHNLDANPQPRDKISGSCIFLHIWKTPDTGTAGCTAMTREHMVEIVRWLDQARHPVLVQLPRSEYTRLQAAWGLPVAN